MVTNGSHIPDGWFKRFVKTLEGTESLTQTLHRKFGNGRYLAPCNVLGGQVPKDEQREKSGIILSHYKYITPFVHNTYILLREAAVFPIGMEQS